MLFSTNEKYGGIMKNTDFVIRSSLDKEDYKKYLFIDMFELRKIFMIFVIACIVTLSLNYVNHTMNLYNIVEYFAIFFCIVIVMRVVQVYTMYYGIARMYDKGDLKGYNIYSFHEDELTIQNSSQNGSATLKYDIFHTVRQTKDFILLYATARQCSVIRKKDVENIDEFVIYLKNKFKKVYRGN